MTNIQKAWAGLAYAIIITAEKDYVKDNSKDAEVFFNSYWYENLKEMVTLANPPKLNNAPPIHNEIH